MTSAAIIRRRRRLVSSAVVPIVLPLDNLPSVASSWSVARRLRTAYTGPLIRVRRSSDNVEQNIGYAALNNLDVTAAQAFCGINSLPNSENITAAASWQLVGVTTALNGTAGNDNIWLMVEDATTAKHRIGSPLAGVAFTAGAAITIEVEVRAAGRSLVQILTGSALTASAINYDLTALTLSLRGSGVSGTITNIGDNWRLLSFTITPGASSTAAVFLQIIQAMTDVRDPLAYAGTPGLGVEVRRFRWRVSATQGAYTPTFGTAITALQDGFITTVYDQSGNGRNAAQTTIANQPQIVASGALITMNGRPVMRGTNGTSSLILATGISGLTDFTIATVIQKTASTNDIIFGNATLNQQIFRVNQSNVPHTFWGANVTSTATWNITTNPGVANFVRAGATVTPYLNGVAAAAMTQTLDAVTFSSIGQLAGTPGYIGAFIGEVIVFSAALSVADRQTLERGQGSYYGITVA